MLTSRLRPKIGDVLLKEYIERVKRLSSLLFFALAASVLGWGFTDHQAFFAGVSLGVIIGLISAIYTAFKIHTIGEAAIGEQRRPGLGMLTRFSLAALGAVIALRFPDVVDIKGLIIGLLVMPAFALGDAIYYNMKTGKARERGE
jgi:ATP synthase protein I